MKISTINKCTSNGGESLGDISVLIIHILSLEIGRAIPLPKSNGIDGYLNISEDLVAGLHYLKKLCVSTSIMAVLSRLVSPYSPNEQKSILFYFEKGFGTRPNCRGRSAFCMEITKRHRLRGGVRLCGYLWRSYHPVLHLLVTTRFPGPTPRMLRRSARSSVRRQVAQQE